MKSRYSRDSKRKILPKDRKKYRILSFDGGGIRGVISLAILQKLNAAVPGWLNQVDMFAGTSTGGIIALQLANGLQTNEILEFYKTKGSSIFDVSLKNKISHMGSFIGPKYSNQPLKKELISIFGDTKLSDLKKSVLIPSFCLDAAADDDTPRCWAPKIFHNLKGDDNDGDLLAYKVALYTSAAPTYFPSVDSYIDGGLYANNPSMCALSQTQDERYFPVPPYQEDIVLLSIGTGQPTKFIEKKNVEWGQIQWIKHLIGIMMDGAVNVAHYECHKMLDDNYRRVAPKLTHDQDYEMDAVSHINDMIKIVDGMDLRKIAYWLSSRWL